MLEAEVGLLYKAEFSLEGGSVSKIFPQCFANRGLSYVNILAKFDQMLTSLGRAEKERVGRVFTPERRALDGITRVKDANKMSESALKAGFRKLKDYFSQ